MSGMFVRVKLPLTGVLNAFLVPQQAVTRGEKDTVMVVTPEGKMEPRPVKVVGQKGTNWIITEGLKAGDKVIVEGRHVRRAKSAAKRMDTAANAKTGRRSFRTSADCRRFRSAGCFFRIRRFRSKITETTAHG